MCGNSSAQHVHFQFLLVWFHFYLPESIPSLFWNSFSAFSLPASNILPLLLTSRFLTLLLSSRHTNGSSSFNLISYALQFSPCFSFTSAFCLRKTFKKSNSILLSKSFSAFSSNITHLGGGSQTFHTTPRQIQVLVYTKLTISQSTCKQFFSVIPCFSQQNVVHQLAMFHKRFKQNIWGG